MNLREKILPSDLDPVQQVARAAVGLGIAAAAIAGTLGAREAYEGFDASSQASVASYSDEAHLSRAAAKHYESSYKLFAATATGTIVALTGYKHTAQARETRGCRC
jgi:hypothetical protein